MANGTMHGEDTTCKRNGQNCALVYTYYRERNNYYSRHKATLIQHKSPKYGEWVDFTYTITFNDQEISGDNAYLTMHMFNLGKKEKLFLHVNF